MTNDVRECVSTCMIGLTTWSAKKKFEDKVEESGVTLFIDPTAVMFILGSEMDYQESKMSSGFVFNNPNEVSRCGCGESFSVK